MTRGLCTLTKDTPPPTQSPGAGPKKKKREMICNTSYAKDTIGNARYLKENISTCRLILNFTVANSPVISFSCFTQQTNLPQIELNQRLYFWEMRWQLVQGPLALMQIVLGGRLGVRTNEKAVTMIKYLQQSSIKSRV